MSDEVAALREEVEKQKGRADCFEQLYVRLNGEHKALQEQVRQMGADLEAAERETRFVVEQFRRSSLELLDRDGDVREAHRQTAEIRLRAESDAAMVEHLLGRIVDAGLVLRAVALGLVEVHSSVDRCGILLKGNGVYARPSLDVDGIPVLTGEEREALSGMIRGCEKEAGA